MTVAFGYGRVSIGGQDDPDAGLTALITAGVDTDGILVSSSRVMIAM